MPSSLRHLLSVGPSAVRHPRQALAFARLRLQSRRDARRERFSTRAHAELVRSRAGAIEELFGVDAREQERMLGDATFPDQLPFDQGSWDSRMPWMELLHLLVRIMRPSSVVETGVQWGYSTATILAALPDDSRLDSVDLPNLDRTSRERHAAAVPPALREQWTLHLGDSRAELPRVLALRRPVDLFVHDSDHTYAGQMTEFRAAWPALRPGAMLVVDDVWHRALIDFAREVDAEPPLLIERTSERDALGLLRRPA